MKLKFRSKADIDDGDNKWEDLINFDFDEPNEYVEDAMRVAIGPVFEMAWEKDDGTLTAVA